MPEEAILILNESLDCWKFGLRCNPIIEIASQFPKS